MNPDSRKRRRRPGLRFKLTIVSLLLVCVPALAVWALGPFDEFNQWYTDRALDSIMVDLDAQLEQHRASIGTLTGNVSWLRGFAQDEHVYIRIISSDGRVIAATDPVHAEPLSALRREFSGLSDVYTHTLNADGGNAPTLAAFEATLAPEAERPEVRAALEGHAMERRRENDDARLVVHYRAMPLRDRSGVAYLARFSARDVRTLFDQRYQLLKLTIVLAVVALLMGLWLGVGVVNPLVLMQKRIQAHMRNPAASGSLALDRHDEIGALSRDFQLLRERLHRATRETAAVAGDLAHDLKNPIATVRATAEMLAERPGMSDDRQQRLANALAQASLHLERSVDGMLRLARLDETLASTTRAEVNLNSLIHELLEGYRRDPATQGVTISEHATGDAVVLGVRDDLAKMLRNLVDNTLVFCKGHVLVVLEPKDEQWAIAVEDDGPGVSPGNRDKVFQRFFSSRPDGAPSGAGLGLAMARAVARAHGGDLTLESGGRLSGARFAVTLPAVRADG